jgi:hypothetical protein
MHCSLANMLPTLVREVNIANMAGLVVVRKRCLPSSYNRSMFALALLSKAATYNHHVAVCPQLHLLAPTRTEHPKSWFGIYSSRLAQFRECDPTQRLHYSSYCLAVGHTRAVHSNQDRSQLRLSSNRYCFANTGKESI